MRKRFWVILLTVLVFLSGTVLGVSAVYRVDHITVEASLVSEEAEAEAEALKERLEEAYDKASIFFANDKKAKEVAKEFPYFRITSFEKSYPNRLIVKITEDAEVYAVEKIAGEEYYILGEDGTVLGVRDTHINALTGAENVILKGVSVTGENGSLPTGDEHFAPLIALCQELSLQLGGIRSNVVSAEVFVKGPETVYRVTMREGVKLYFDAPSDRMEEKVKEALDKYLPLTDEQKLSGMIVVSEKGSNIFADYAEEDRFES